MTLPASSLVERVAAAIQSHDHASLRRANVDAYYGAARAAIAVVVAEAVKRIDAYATDETWGVTTKAALKSASIHVRALSPTPKDDA